MNERTRWYILVLVTLTVLAVIVPAYRAQTAPAIHHAAYCNIPYTGSFFRCDLMPTGVHDQWV